MKIKHSVESLKPLVRKTWKLLQGDLLQVEISPSDRVKKFIVRQAQLLYLVARGFIVDHCSLHAASLTYMTLLSIVPLLAFGFAISKGFGVQNALVPIIDRLTVGQRDIAERMIEYINRTNVGALGTIGLVTLAITVISTFTKVEKTFNIIWGVTKSRSFARKITDYISISVVVPILIIAATGVNTTLASNAIIARLRKYELLSELLDGSFKLAPFITIWIAFIFMYSFIPNIKVKLWPAIVGGVAAGSLWQGAQWAFITFQVGVSKYNAIYGTFSSLPIFLLWLYINWEIILIGAQMSYVRQNIRTLREQIDLRMVSHFVTEVLTVRILFAIVEHFYANKPAWNSSSLAEELGVPVKVVRDILNKLILLHYIVETAGESLTIVLNRSPLDYSLRDLLKALRTWEPLKLDYERDEVTRSIENLVSIQASAATEALLDSPVHNLYHHFVSQIETSLPRND